MDTKFGMSYAPHMIIKTALAALLLVLATGCKQRATVIINAPIERVWEYAGDSSKASEWSIFFDHISPLPGIPDGQVGALRRCYRRADGSGVTWDERVVKINRPFGRQIRTFNIVNSAHAGLEKIEFDVFHKLKRIGPNQTELTFSSEAATSNEAMSQLSLSEIFKWFLLRQDAAEIVQKNVENIKLLIENPNVSEADLHPFMVDDNEHFDIAK